MSRFKAQKIRRSAPVGEILQQARQERHFSVNFVAKQLKIPEAYLVALEAGEWEVLPAGDYGRYFLKKYATFLKLEVDDLLEQYPGPNLPQIIQPPQRPLINNYQSIHPLRRALLLLVALVVVFYLLVASRAIFMPTHLEIISPSADGVSSSSSLVLSGITKPGTEVTVNNEAIQVSETGNFRIIIPLRPGLNHLVIKAKKSLSRQVVIERRIYYSPLPDSFTDEFEPTIGGD